MVTDAEIWKPIEGYSDYSISNYGRVLSLKSELPKILKPGANGHGYHRVHLLKDSKDKYPNVARLVAKAFIPNPENKHQINHIDGNKTNNHISNLEWVTDSENKKHAIKTGLHPVYTPKITSSQAIEIFQKFHSGKFNQYQLSLEYNLSYAAISNITHGRSWYEYTKRYLSQIQSESNHRKMRSESKNRAKIPAPGDLAKSRDFEDKGNCLTPAKNKISIFENRGETQ